MRSLKRQLIAKNQTGMLEK